MMSKRILTKDDMISSLESIVASYEIQKDHGVDAEVPLYEYDIACVKMAIATLTKKIPSRLYT